MNRRTFIHHTSMLTGATVLSPELFSKSKTMKIHFLRHATFLLEVNGVKLLVDPMLSAKDALDPVANAANSIRIPMVDLPLTENELKEKLATLDAVMVTHTHRDHWDIKAHELLKKDMTILCQPADVEAIEEKGFTRLLPVNNSIEFNGLTIHRTGGQHGTGDIGLKMGHVSGFVIETKMNRLYIAGDTIWCAEVESALKKFKPDTIILNTGAAQFLQGDPITMTAQDVLAVSEHAPQSKIIAVHMDTVNHCLLKRKDLHAILEKVGKLKQVRIPSDGEVIFI